MAFQLLDAVAGQACFVCQGGLGELLLFPPAEKSFFQELAHVGEVSIDAS